MIWLLLIGVGVLSALLLPPWWQARRHRALRALAPPDFWLRVIARRVPLVAQLPPELRARLHQRMRVFLAEVPFIGCRGLEVTEEMRVTIAAQACLLILQRGDDAFARVRQVLLYHDAFRVHVRHQDAAGVVIDSDDVRAGESWHEGQVVLSWTDVLDGAADPHDGFNVVLHEFAHQLDDMHGLSHDIDPEGHVPAPEAAGDWTRTLDAAYRRLVAQVARQERAHAGGHAHHADHGGHPVLDPYGASDPCEFFAVVTEAFFEQGAALRAHEPDLYAALSRFYRLDPAGWAKARSAQAQTTS
jgi:Mlc titration factor MtfA (ptsG expression regulator)